MSAGSTPSQSSPISLPEGTKVSSFINSRSQKIHTIQIDPINNTQPATATIFVLHGLGDHSGRPGYCRFYQRLVDQNCRVLSMDHHGHGQSDGSPRCYCNKFDDYIDDYLMFVENNWNKDDDPPLFLIGQSLGGLMAILLSVRLGGDKKVKGMILSSPACGVEMNLEMKIQLFLAPLIDFLIPKAKIVDAVDYKDITRNEKEMEAYIADPLITKGRLCARTGIQISYTFEKLRNELTSMVNCPLLITHGTDDKITDINSSMAFFHGTSTSLKHKMFVKLPGFRHEVYNEIEVEREPVLEFMVKFVTSGATQFPGSVKGGDGGTEATDNRVIDFELSKD